MRSEHTEKHSTSRRGSRVALAAAALSVAALVATGCGSKDEPAATTATTAASSSSGTTPGTKAPGTTSTTAKTSGTTPGTTKPTGTTRPTGTTTVGAAPGTNAELETTDEAKDVTWVLNAAEYQGDIGARVAYECTPDGEPSTVWGSGTYTDDSSVCTAAVHAGLIDFADGGRVVIEIRDGEDAYTASTANGVTTLEYASWGGSFVFPGA